MKNIYFFIFVLLLVSFVLCTDINNEKCNLSHNDAVNKVRGVGIGISSSCNCIDRNRACCTSLDKIRCRSIDGILTLKSASNCPITITGGTETGHGNPNGQWSHWNGWRLDISLNVCLENYIRANFQYIGRRGGDNAEQWRSSSGNIYAKEKDHWDITWLW